MKPNVWRMPKAKVNALTAHLRYIATLRDPKNMARPKEQCRKGALVMHEKRKARLAEQVLVQGK